MRWNKNVVSGWARRRESGVGWTGRNKLRPYVFLLLVGIMLVGCSTPWNTPTTMTATPTPQFAGGEPVLPQLQQLYRDAPSLPTDIMPTDSSWSLAGHDAANTSATIASAIHGTVRWFFQTPGPVLSSPIVTDGLALVNGGNGVLYAVNVSTGTMKWRTPVGDTLVAGTAAVADGIVYVAAQGHGLMALRLATGTPLWTVDTQLPVRAAPLVVGSELFVATGANTLLCLNKQTGAEYWAFKSEDVYANFWPTQGQPAVTTADNGRVFIALGASTEFNALDLRTGRKAWEQTLDSRMVGSPVYDEQKNLVYVATWTGHMYAMDGNSGTIRWRFNVPSQLSQIQNGLATNAALADDTLFFGDYRGNIFALNALTGQLRWIHHTTSAIVATPVVQLTNATAAEIYIAEQNGSLLALDATNGSRVWQRTLGELRSSPVLANNMLFIGSISSHGLFALT